MTGVTFGRSPDRRPPYTGVTTESLYVPMSDGVRIAVDVMRPARLRPALALPAILIIARYWRSFALRSFAPPHRAPVGPRQPLPDFLLARGYAVVAMDTRGSGASAGSTPYPFNEREIQDYGEVVDWIVRQTSTSTVLARQPYSTAVAPPAKYARVSSLATAPSPLMNR